VGNGASQSVETVVKGEGALSADHPRDAGQQRELSTVLVDTIILVAGFALAAALLWWLLNKK
jgi:hypothetical protein